MREDKSGNEELLAVHDTVGHGDSRTYRAYPFEVPSGTTALNLAFGVEPREVGPYAQAIGVAVYSPSGLRGIPGRAPWPARLAVDAATPGFIPGPIEAGPWTLEVSLGYVLEGPPCSYDLRVWAEHTPADAASGERPSLPRAIPGTGPGWYAGDLHMHTHHSDGWWSVDDLWQAVQRRGLDFFVLTDHNILSGLAEVAALETGRVLPLPGLEVTTMHGHMLAVGTQTLIDWRLDRPERSIAGITRDVHAAGALAIIAHPRVEGSPYCHGCRWDVSEVDPAQVDAVEVWNGPWRSGRDGEDNERGLLFWEDWLNRGYRIPLSGGSDAHGEEPDFKPGVPTTHVYARELSREAILEGLRAGRTVLSSGPLLRLRASAGEATGGPGDTLPAHGPLALEATVEALSTPGRLRFIGNGAIVFEQELSAGGTYSCVIEQPEAGWYRVDLRDAEGGAMLAVTSALYVAG